MATRKNYSLVRPPARKKSHKKQRSKAKKELGQNFLKAPRFAYRLVEKSGVGPTDTVVEVGSGKGMITRILLQNAKRVIGVELDPNLYEFLEKKFPEEIEKGKLVLVNEDILKFNPADYGLKNGGYKLIGSIPYYITGVFIRTFLTMEAQPNTIGIIIQKEVAERIIVRDGKGSILSVSVGAYGSPKYVTTIKARDFSPKPKVDSAILIIQNISRDFFTSQDTDGEISEDDFFKFMKKGFSSKRKKLLGNLASLFSKDDLKKAFTKNNISHDARAENLSTDDWKALVQTLFK